MPNRRKKPPEPWRASGSFFWENSGTPTSRKPEHEDMDFDAIVIGSGFGGAITACRLAEANYKVLILERGRRWDKTNYPRVAGDMWTWNEERPEKENGWIDLSVFPHMSVVRGAAVGGGSLIYANISVEPSPSVFQAGWPREVTYAELKP